MGEKGFADRCAEAVDAYWKRLGFDVKAHTKQITRNGRPIEAWEIVSSTENGLPYGCDSRQVPLYGAAKKRAEG